MSKPVTNVPKVLDGEVKLITLDRLVPFSKHAFTLYQGERLDDMVESIRKNGVIVPIIARTTEDIDKFEIISGHNRVYASGLAGLEKVPAVIKVGLSDEEAMIYAIDSNLIQRSIKDLKISEQAYAVSMRYHRLFDEKKVAEIDEELHVLIGNCSPVGNKRKTGNGSPLGNGYKPRTMDIAGIEYGMSRMTVARLIRINLLCDNLKNLVDTGNIRIRPAVELSFIPTEEQEKIFQRMSATGQNIIDMNMSKALRALFRQSNGEDIKDEQIDEILDAAKSERLDENKRYRIPMKLSVFERYLRNVPPKEVENVVERALEMYFKEAKT